MSNIGALPLGVALFVPTSRQRPKHLSRAFGARFRSSRAIAAGRMLFLAVDRSDHHRTKLRIHAEKSGGAKDPGADGPSIFSSDSDPKDTY